jgi:hypothetical protein
MDLTLDMDEFKKVEESIKKSIESTLDMIQSCPEVYTRWDLMFVAQQVLHTCSTVLCAKACGGAWDCEYCPISNNLKDLQVIVDKFKKEKEEAKEEDKPDGLR